MIECYMYYKHKTVMSWILHVLRGNDLTRKILGINRVCEKYNYEEGCCFLFSSWVTYLKYDKWQSRDMNFWPLQISDRNTVCKYTRVDTLDWSYLLGVLINATTFLHVGLDVPTVRFKIEHFSCIWRTDLFKTCIYMFILIWNWNKYSYMYVKKKNVLNTSHVIFHVLLLF